MISLDKSVLNILKDAPTGSTSKIFLFIALNQPEEGICGLRITKEKLAVALNAGKSSIFRDLKWLKDNLLIQELKFADDFDYMVNPRFVMNNSDREARIAEWKRRLDLDDEKIKRNRELKRRRELKKANPQ